MNLVQIRRCLLRAGCFLVTMVMVQIYSNINFTKTAQANSSLSIRKSARAPSGFLPICGRYSWACSNRAGTVSEARKLELARKVNSIVNRSVRSASDSSVYGREENWALPSGGRGDCEDYALLKMKQLVEAGIASKDVLLATVLTRKAEHHVVLVIRTKSGDYFLDNLTDTIRPWRRSGYTVVKMQLPNNRSSWGLVLQGPMAGGG